MVYWTNTGRQTRAMTVVIRPTPKYSLKFLVIQLLWSCLLVSSWLMVYAAVLGSAFYLTARNGKTSSGNGRGELVQCKMGEGHNTLTSSFFFFVCFFRVSAQYLLVFVAVFLSRCLSPVWMRCVSLLDTCLRETKKNTINTSYEV